MTKADFLNVVLRNIGKIRIGQSASTTDMSAVSLVYDTVYSNLQNDSLTTWDINGEIPGWAVQPLKKIVSAEAVSEFVVPRAIHNQLKSEERAGFIQLVQGMNQDYTPEVFKSEYF